MKSICVFCGASIGNQPLFAEAAARVGRALASAGIELIYGGGNVGLMGVLADAALQAGGRVVGVIPEALRTLELAHTGLTEQHIVRSMHERKALMADRSDAFIGLPGGIGTLEEFFEVWTWSQLGIHRKPLGLLNVGGYFDLLLAFLDKNVVASGFVQQKSRDLVCVSTEPEDLISHFRNFMPPDVRRFVRKDER